MVFEKGWARIARKEGSNAPGYALQLFTRVGEAERMCVSSLSKVPELQCFTWNPSLTLIYFSQTGVYIEASKLKELSNTVLTTKES